MAEKKLFEENQYLGFNKFSAIRRMVIAIFCFVAYYLTGEMPAMEQAVPAGDLLFYMGIAILLISVLLMFVLHLKTLVTENSIILDGIWTARKVKIDLHSIVSVKKIPYSNYKLNGPVYNLHRKGRIKFYTRGSEAVELLDRDGLRYIIGSQRASELAKLLHDIIHQPAHGA
ncbi:MAG: hypothetical protein ACE5DN_06765 [Flavobacteriales bacterium]